MDASPFVMPVGDLGSGHVVSRPVHIEAATQWHVEMSSVLEDPPVVFDGEMTYTSGGLVLRGTVGGVVHHTCSRCLDEWDEPVTTEVAQLILPGSVDDGGEEDDDYVYEGDKADLEPVLRDELLLSLPLLPTCPDGCQRLVEVGRNDLNTGAPDDTGESVSPFAVLKDLLDHEH